MIAEILLSSIMITLSSQTVCENRCQKTERVVPKSGCPEGMKARDCKNNKKAIEKQDFKKICIAECIKAEARRKE